MIFFFNVYFFFPFFLYFCSQSSSFSNSNILSKNNLSRFRLRSLSLHKIHVCVIYSINQKIKIKMIVGCDLIERDRDVKCARLKREGERERWWHAIRT
jgi:hypothetical protein